MRITSARSKLIAISVIASLLTATLPASAMVGDAAGIAGGNNLQGAVIIAVDGVDGPGLANLADANPNAAVGAAGVYVAAVGAWTRGMFETRVGRFFTALGASAIAATPNYLAYLSAATLRRFPPNPNDPTRNYTSDYLGSYLDTNSGLVARFINGAVLVAFMVNQVPAGWVMTTNGKFAIPMTQASIFLVSDAARFGLQEFLKTGFINGLGWTTTNARVMAWGMATAVGIGSNAFFGWLTDTYMTPNYVHVWNATRHTLEFEIDTAALSYNQEQIASTSDCKPTGKSGQEKNAAACKADLAAQKTYQTTYNTLYASLQQNYEMYPLGNQSGITFTGIYPTTPTSLIDEYPDLPYEPSQADIDTGARAFTDALGSWFSQCHGTQGTARYPNLLNMTCPLDSQRTVELVFDPTILDANGNFKIIKTIRSNVAPYPILQTSGPLGNLTSYDKM